MLNFTFRQLEYFRAVAQQGSISAAAEQERISRSALASAITDLEAILGCQLLTRHKAKGVVLTPVGAHLLEMSNELIESASRIEASLRGNRLSGTLGIGCFASLGPTLIPSLFTHFQDRYPDVRLRLRTGAHEELVALLESGEIELAIGYGLHPTDILDTEELYEDRMHVILPQEHRLAEHDALRPEQLMQEDLILLDTPPSSENVRLYFAAQGLALKPRFRFQEFEVVRSLVARGIGYSVVVQHPASDVSYEGLGIVTRPLDPVPTAVPVSCAWVDGRTLTPPALEARRALRVLAPPSKLWSPSQ